MDFKNKNIVVTGATSGIGYALVKELIKYEGCKVCAVGRNPRKLKILKVNLGSSIFTLKCDLKNPEEIYAMSEKLFTKEYGLGGKVDIFIACAGFGYYEKFDTRPGWVHISDIFRLNTVSTLYTLARINEKQKGLPYQFVIICSGVARMPIPGYSLYCATKFALDGFVRAYNYEKDDNVILSCVYPVAVRTDFYKKCNKYANIPLFRQSMSKNVKHILRGIRRNKKYIYPSFLYKVFLIINNIVPIGALYSCIEKLRLKRWIKYK